MPYGGTTPEQDKQIDDCVSSDKWAGKINSRTGKPYTKSEKVAICKSRALKSSIVELNGKWYNVSEAQGSLDIDIIDEIITDCDGICDTVGEAVKLTYEKRQALSDSDFCLVYTERGKSGKMLKRRRFPAHDAAHVRNGLSRLPQANLTPAQRSKVRSCLVSRAKKYGVKVAQSELESSYARIPERPEGLEAFVGNGDGTYTILAGMEGQNIGNPYTGEVFTISREFFESQHKQFEGRFYYPNHESKRDVDKRVAIILTSELKELTMGNGSKRLGMLHTIKPRNQNVAADIENGFYDDVSIDIIGFKTSQDDDLLIVDGEPLGVAFVAGLKWMKGCPECNTVHPIAESCITHQSPDGTPSVPRHENPKEGQSLTKKTDEIDDGTTSGEDNPGGVSQDEKDASAQTSKRMAELEAEVLNLKFGSEVEALAQRAGVEAEALMKIVDSTKSQAQRLESVQALVEKFENDKKELMKEKVVEDEAQAEGDGDAVDDDPDHMTKKQYDALSAELNGQVPPKTEE